MSTAHPSTASPSPDSVVPDGATPATPRRRFPSRLSAALRRPDLIVAGLALALAAWVTSGLWLDPAGRAITVNSGDQALFEWLLAYGAHALIHGENPLFTYGVNVPDGVNLAVNTSISVYAFAFAPLTLLAGPSITFAVILTGNLAASGYAWYWFFSRPLHLPLPADRFSAGGLASPPGPLAAAVAGLFCGFAPQMVSHANAHLNWTAQWLVPLLLWRVLALREPGRALRNGMLLGLLVAVAFSIAAEALFFTALACAVFLGCWAVARMHREQARAGLPAFLRGLAVTGVTALALLSYPLWLHFFGPQRFHGTGFDHRIHAEDVAAYGAFPARSLAGAAGLDTSLAPNPTEENSFFGLPLLLLAVACAVLVWRRAAPVGRATLRALLITGGTFVLLSFGRRVKWFGEITEIPLPYEVLGRLPVFNAALPARLALVVTPVVGLLLAWALTTLAPLSPRSSQGRPATGAGGRWGVVAWVAAFVAALVPLVPVPLITDEREPVPHFITSGRWRDYVSDGGVLVPVPPTSDLLPDGQRWQAHALAAGWMIALVGVVGVLLVAAGVVGIVRSRRRAAAEPATDASQPVRAAARVPGAAAPVGAESPGNGQDDPNRSGAVYGGTRVGAAAPAVDRENSGAVYGAGAGAPDRRRPGSGRGSEYPVDRADSGAVYGAGRGYDVDGADRGAASGAARTNPYQNQDRGMPQGGEPPRGGHPRTGRHPQPGAYGDREYGAGHPDEGYGYQGDRYGADVDGDGQPGNGYAGYAAQPAAGRRPPEGQGYDEADYDYRDRGRQGY